MECLYAVASFPSQSGFQTMHTKQVDIGLLVLVCRRKYFVILETRQHLESYKRPRKQQQQLSQVHKFV